jgi:hypothetical protein
MAGGRWLRAALGAAVAVFLGAITYVVLIKPVADNTAQTGPDSQHPPAAASLAPHSGGPATEAPQANSSDPDPSGVKMPVGNLPGWRQVFTDDFDRASLGAKWDPYTGPPDGDPGGYFDPSRVSVGGGLLTIGAWPDPGRGGIYVTGGVSNRNVLADTYGRFDIRFRMDQGQGIAYALLLWPTNNDYPPEIDIAEDNGRDRKTMYSNVHPAGGGPIQNMVGGDFSQWHTAGVEWTPDAVVFTLDGRPWSSVKADAVPDEPMALALQTQAWYCGHTWEACPNSSTPPRVNLLVDWVVGYRQDR